MKFLFLILLFPVYCSAQTLKHSYYTIHFDAAEHGPDYSEYWMTKAKLNHVVKRPNDINSIEVDSATFYKTVVK